MTALQVSQHYCEIGADTLMPRAEHKRTPKVMSGWLYTETGAIQLGTPEWWTWLQSGASFYYSDTAGTFTAVCETRRSGHFDRPFWYAHRRYHGRLYRMYLGTPEELTPARLATVASSVASRIEA